MTQATLGLRVHTGWAALVALAGPRTAPRVIARHRIEMVGDPYMRFCYHHAAENLARAAAKRHIAKTTRTARAAAAKALGGLLRELRGEHTVKRAAVVAANVDVPDALDTILASHALIHSAEGELFRSALVAACTKHGVAVLAVPARELRGHPLAVKATALGKGLGSPWAQDQKDAALVAWLAMG